MHETSSRKFFPEINVGCFGALHVSDSFSREAHSLVLLYMQSTSIASFLFPTQVGDQMLMRFWAISNGGDKSWRKANLRDFRMNDAIRTILSSGNTISLHGAASAIHGITLVYSRAIEFFETKLLASMQSIDLIYHPQAHADPGSVSKSSRKRRLSATPLPPLPENEVLFDANADMLQITIPGVSTSVMSRTPVTGRKRLFSTPGSSRLLPLDEEPVFDSTPVVFTPSMDSKRQKRMSSVSDVMDSLRADDGQRRLSGLLMTADGTVPPSPSINDHFDTGIDPPSPWDEGPDELTSSLLALPPLTSPTVAGSARLRSRPKKQVKRSAFLDGRGRWAIEIEPTKVQERREWYMNESTFYMNDIRADRNVRFNIAEVVGDRTSHFSWYRPPLTKLPRGKRVEKAREADVEDTTGPEFDTDFPDLPDFDMPLSPAPQVHRSDMSIVEILSAYPSKSASLKALVENSATRPSKRAVARNLVEVLGLVSCGNVKLTPPKTERIGFSDFAANTMLVACG